MGKSIRCAIVDDEPLAINIVKNYLSKIDGFEISATFKNGLEALSYLKSQSVDVMFLDINMPILDGLNLIKNLEEPPLVVIISAYENYAIETYELDVIDYLLKPVEFGRFLKSIHKIENHFQSKQFSSKKLDDRPYIFVKIDKKKIKKIYLEDILSIESLKDYIKINTIIDKYIVHSTLTDFTEKLPPNEFIRIHRSYTIAINKIESIEGNCVEINGVRYNIGRSYHDKVFKTVLNR